MKVKSMYVRVGADTKDMERALKGARAKMKAFGSQIKKIGKVMAVAGVAITGAVVLMAKKTIDKYVEVGDAIDKMSKRTGFAAESLSELAYAADISGTNLDTVEKAVKKMATSIVEANDGMATYTEAFDRIGLSAEDLINLKPEEQFDKITMAIADLENPTLRAATAQEIFGRAGTALLPLMAEGAEGMRKLREEAHRLGYVFDEETAAKAAKLKDAQTALKKAFEGVAFTIVSETIPVLTVLTAKFTEVFVGIREEGRGLSSMIVGFFDVIVKATGGVLTGFKAFYISMLKLNKTMAETLMITLEEIEYAVVMSKNYLLMAKLLPSIGEALARLNEIRKLDIDLIEKEEEALVNLMGFFTDLRREIAAVGDAYKNMAGIVVDIALPAARDMTGVLENTQSAFRDMSGVLEQAQTALGSYVFAYMEAMKEMTESQKKFMAVARSEFETMELTLRGFVGAILGTFEKWAIGQAVAMTMKIPFPASLIAMGVAIAAIRTVFAGLKSFKEGGFIEKETLARLHPGEYVLPAPTVKALTRPAFAATAPASVFHTYLTINTKTLNDYTINRAAEKIFAAMEREKMRRGY